MTDTAIRRTVRALLPKPVRVAYWRMRDAAQHWRISRGRAHERHVCQALRRMIQPGDVCLDAGANVGLLTRFMARCTGPAGRVHAFEPAHGNVAALRTAVARDGLTGRVTITHAAVSDGSQPHVTLYAGRNGSSREWNITGLDAAGNAAPAVATVRAIAMDDHFRPDEKIDVVKIDVEGAESQVLAGMRRILVEWRPRLLIECHSAENWRACAALERLGYILADTHGRRLDATDDYPAAHVVALPKARVEAAAIAA